MHLKYPSINGKQYCNFTNQVKYESLILRLIRPTRASRLTWTKLQEYKDVSQPY